MRANHSLASSLASRPGLLQSFLRSLSPDEARLLEYEWPFWARPKQLPPPGDWTIWLILAGRGFGKTRTGAEWVRCKVAEGARRIALVSDTAADVRDVMVEGPVGIQAISPPWDRPKYEPSKRRLTWRNGAVATLYAAEAPNLLRGPQHDCAWVDEVAKWRNLRKVDAEGGTAWDNLLMGLRMGDQPQVCATTTPRPLKLLRDLLKDSTASVTRGSTYENLLNLAPVFRQRVVARYEGTRLGRQELDAEILDDVPGALWTHARLDILRVAEVPVPLVRIVVAIDPAGSSSEDAAETGIVVVGLGADGHLYVLDDVSLHGTPGEWARAALNAYHHWEADFVVAEVNNGGEMVEHTLRSTARKGEYFRYEAVHASRGKVTRAEPIAALYEKASAHHVGCLPQLEDQLCTWVPGEKSPDRLDALVWGCTKLCPNRPSGELSTQDHSIDDPDGDDDYRPTFHLGGR